MPGTLAPWPAANVQDVAAAGGSFAMYDQKSGQIALPQNRQGMPAIGSYDNQRWMPGNGNNAPGSWAKASAQPFVPTDRHNNGSGTFPSATTLSASSTTSGVPGPAVPQARQSHQVFRDAANTTESFSSQQRNQYQQKSATHQPFESSVGNQMDRRRRVNNARLGSSRPTAAEDVPAAGQATVPRQQMHQQNRQQHQYQRHHHDGIIPGTVGHDREKGSSEKHTRPRSCIDALNLEAVVSEIPIEGSILHRQKQKGLSQQQLFAHQRSQVVDRRIAAGADAAAGPWAAASLGKTQQKDNKGNPTREKYVPPALRKRKEEEEAALKARQHLEAQAERETRRDTLNIESARVEYDIDEKGDKSRDFKEQGCAGLTTEETAAEDGALDVSHDSKLMQSPARVASAAHVEAEVIAPAESAADEVVVIEEAPLISVEEVPRFHAALTEDVPVKTIVEEEQTVAPEVPAEAPQDKPVVGQASWADRLKAISAKPAPKSKAPPPKPVGIPHHPKPAPWAKERDQRQFEESRKQREEEAERLRRQTEQREREERLQQEKVENEAEERQQREETEARVKAEAEKNLREEEAERMRKEEEERLRNEAEELLWKEAEKRAQQEAEQRAIEEEEERVRKEEEEKRARKDLEERMRKEAEDRERKEAEERLRKEAEELMRQEAEKRARKETEERLQREAEERLRKEAEERARKEAEERAKKEVEERRKKEAEERRREAEARAQKEAEEQAQKEAEERARKEAEEIAQQEAKELARKKAAAEECARKEEEDRKRQEAEERKRKEAEEVNIAEEFARTEAEKRRTKEAEERLRSEAEEKALRDAAQRGHDEEEDRIRREAQLAQSGKDQIVTSVDSAEERLAKPSPTAWVSKRSKAKAASTDTQLVTSAQCAPANSADKDDVNLSRHCKEDASFAVNDELPAAGAKSRATADGAPIDAPSATSAAPAEVKKLGGLFAKPKGARKGLKKSTAGTSGSTASEVQRDEEEEKEEDASREDVSPPVVAPEARPSTSATAATIPIPPGDEFEAAAFAAVNAMKARDNSQDSLRDVFLSYRFLAAEVPTAVAQLVAREREGAWQAGSAPHVSDRGGRSGGGERVVDRSMFGTRMSCGKDSDRRGDRRERGERQDRGDRQERNARGQVLVPSETAWKPSSKEADGKKSPKQELTRQAQGLLNKICPENVQVIATRIKNELQVNTVQELKWLIESVFKKALHEIHYSETYADLVYRLKTEMPEFPSENGGKPITFKSTLLNVCQSEFESMLSTLSSPQDEKDRVDAVDADELEMRRQKRKARILANMRFIGNLFLRQLLTAKIIASVLSELTLQENPDANVMPEEHVIECICQLLSSIGYTLESVPGGKQCLQSVCGRMLDLKNRKAKDGTKIFSKRIQFHIQDVLDTRAAGWAKRTFKKEAATRDEIRAAHERDLAAAASGKKVDEADVVIAGARPAYMAPESGGNTKGADGKETWQEAAKPRRERKV
eukprot:TRINITY_DN197_c0_g1_i1.p1 TRINITY_DN197_c0_g1~~TRINITY_DN197_c0_g1_i1.p1  ORF type:complete len:1640 (-),score=390.38 TRINITY_DN197_c0_g1_i1:349-4806(-)